METLVLKCLNKREKCFEINACPDWLLSLLPVATRIQSIEPIVDQKTEDKVKEVVDLSPYKLVSTINVLNDDLINQFSCENKTNVEYPNDASFENDLFSSYSQLITSPSNQQLVYLLKKLTQFKKNQTIKTTKDNKDICKQINCSNRSIPLTSYCKDHILEYDQKQVLFVKCHLCQQTSIQHDNNNILHFCSYLNQ